MSSPEPAFYRTTNWKSQNEALKRRGSLLIWLYKDMVCLAPNAGRPGRPPVFSEAAIRFCLMVKVLCGLPLRQTTGMVSRKLQMAGLDWPVPDFAFMRLRQRNRRDREPPGTWSPESVGEQHRDQVPWR